VDLPSRQLVVAHSRGTRAGRVVTPASSGRPPCEGEAGHRCVLPLLSLGAHPAKATTLTVKTIMRLLLPLCAQLTWKLREGFCTVGANFATTASSTCFSVAPASTCNQMQQTNSVGVPSGLELIGISKG
jgi:hypothetical protein